MAVTLQAATFVSNFDGTLPFSSMTAQIALGAAVPQTYTVPGISRQKYRVEFSYNVTSNIFVGYNVTAAIPGAGSVTEVGKMEFIPKSARFVFGGDVLSFITPDATAYLGISLLAIPA